MGLDMRLKAVASLRVWSEDNVTLSPSSVRVFKEFGVPLPADLVLPAYRLSLEFTVISWRHASYIHYWFLSRVQQGHDDGREYRVSCAVLQTLLMDCKTALETDDFRIFACIDYESVKKQVEYTERELTRVMGYLSGKSVSLEFYYIST